MLVLVATLSTGAVFPAVADEKPAPAPAEAAHSEKCGVVHEVEGGKYETTIMPSLHVLELTDDAVFALPPDAPAKVSAVMCGRDDIVPSRNDYKVLVAGYVLAITTGGRVLYLEAADGQLQLKFGEGQMTEAEAGRMQAFLNEAQLAFDKSPRPAKGK